MSLASFFFFRGERAPPHKQAAVHVLFPTGLPTTLRSCALASPLQLSGHVQPSAVVQQASHRTALTDARGGFPMPLPGQMHLDARLPVPDLPYRPRVEVYNRRSRTLGTRRQHPKRDGRHCATAHRLSWQAGSCGSAPSLRSGGWTVLRQCCAGSVAWKLSWAWLAFITLNCAHVTECWGWPLCGSFGERKTARDWL